MSIRDDLDKSDSQNNCDRVTRSVVKQKAARLRVEPHDLLYGFYEKPPRKLANTKSVNVVTSRAVSAITCSGVVNVTRTVTFSADATDFYANVSLPTQVRQLSRGDKIRNFFSNTFFSPYSLFQPANQFSQTFFAPVQGTSGRDTNQTVSVSDDRIFQILLPRPIAATCSRVIVPRTTVLDTHSQFFDDSDFLTDSATSRIGTCTGQFNNSDSFDWDSNIEWATPVPIYSASGQTVKSSPSNLANNQILSCKQGDTGRQGDFLPIDFNSSYKLRNNPFSSSFDSDNTERDRQRRLLDDELVANKVPYIFPEEQFHFLNSGVTEEDFDNDSHDLLFNGALLTSPWAESTGHSKLFLKGENANAIEKNLVLEQRPAPYNNLTQSNTKNFTSVLQHQFEQPTVDGFLANTNVQETPIVDTVDQKDFGENESDRLFLLGLEQKKILSDKERDANFLRFLKGARDFNPDDEIGYRSNSQSEVSDNQYLSSDLDSDSSDEEMSAHTHPIAPFKGGYADNAEQWVEGFQLWAETIRNLTPRAKLAHFSLFMRDAAKSWIKEFDFVDRPPVGTRLFINQIWDFDDLRRRFLEKFRRPDNVSWQQISALFERLQGPTESTEAYVTEMQRRGDMAGADLQNIRMSILHGLRHNVKSVVMMHDTNTLSEIVHWGVTAENLAEQGGAEANATMANLQKMMDNFSKVISGNTTEQKSPTPVVAVLPMEDDECHYVALENRGEPSTSYRGRGGANRNRGPRTYTSPQGNQGYALQPVQFVPQNFAQTNFTPLAQAYASPQQPIQTFQGQQYYMPQQQGEQQQHFATPMQAPTNNFQLAPTNNFQPAPANNFQQATQSYRAPPNGFYNSGYGSQTRGRAPQRRGGASGQFYDRQPIRQNFQPGNQNTQTFRCQNCNYVHGPGLCRAQGQACNLCGKKGHFQICCRSAPQSS